MSKIVIKITKFLDKDRDFTPSVRIESVSALREEELPHEYISEWPHCVGLTGPHLCIASIPIAMERSEDVRCIQITHNSTIKNWIGFDNSDSIYSHLSSTINVGSVLTKKRFESMLKLLKKCAKRLSKIHFKKNLKCMNNKEIYKDWSGEETIEI